MNCLNDLERKALRNAALGGEWEYRAKIGGEKTFATLLQNGWIEPFPGHNPDGDRYSITPAGREARKLPPCPRPGRDPRLQGLPSRLRGSKGRLDR
jgi:hypothetical protein